MGIEFVVLKCPQCGAQLQIENGRKQAYCSYCGAKILIHNENEYIHRTIDEAEIVKTEADREIRLKELEMRNKNTNLLKWVAILYFAFVAVLFIISLVGDATGNESSSLYRLYAILLFFIGICVLLNYIIDKK